MEIAGDAYLEILLPRHTIISMSVGIDCSLLARLRTIISSTVCLQGGLSLVVHLAGVGWSDSNRPVLQGGHQDDRNATLR